MAKSYGKTNDPFLDRETQKYEFPIPSREFIIAFLEENDRPVSFEHIQRAMHLDKPEEIEGLRRRLKAMQRDGQIIVNRRGSYALVKELELIAGRIEGTRDGYGFLIPDNESEDIFLSVRQMKGIFPGDRVLVRVVEGDQRKRREGVIVEVLEHNTQQLVGRYYEENGISFIVPDNKAIARDIVVPTGQQNNAKPGQFVIAEIILQPSIRREPLAKIVNVLGDHLTPGMETELAIRSYEIPYVWPETVLAEAKHLPSFVQEKSLEQRKDLRSLPLVTIDGEDAKDFDDAVYCEQHAKGWRLYVAIADVTYYVKPGSALDHEAQARGNSVYFPNRVIPMLPEQLSNGLCSLKPNVDRLAVVCEMILNHQAIVQESFYYEAVIRSQARLTYTEVAETLKGVNKGNQKLVPHLHEFHRLYKQLLKQRKARGAIDFDKIETRIEFGKNGKIMRIVPVVRNDAHRMIEEAMLLANKTIAEQLEKANIPTLYRIHEGPDEIKLKALREFLKVFGLRLTGGAKPTAADYSKLMERVMQRPDFHLLQTVMLRSLKQAIYSPKNAGHFGLSFESYCHFTSPIRRYPDVLVHRAVKHLLQNKKSEKFYHDHESMEKLGIHFSKTERRADEATRDATDWLKCEYMMDKVGQIFEGIITDVTGFGIFVELKDIYVQGLVHVTALLNDYYHHDATHRLLRGKYSGKVYRLGDVIHVLVARVDLNRREIDFELAGISKTAVPRKKKHIEKQSPDKKSKKKSRRKNKKR